MSKNCTNDGCNCTPNSAIKCSVTNCAHHCQDVDHCGLTSIQVGTHEANPTRDQGTDGPSYRRLYRHTARGAGRLHRKEGGP